MVKRLFQKAWAFGKKVCIGIKNMIMQKYRLKDHYRDLAPIDNISNGKEYLKALHWAIRNKRIHNIALTGPYGSGKSSIINSYLKRHPLIRARHLRISMATFIENTAGNKQQKITVEQEQIEEGILKQLFYKVNHRRIPQSRYRKLYKVSFWPVWFMLALFLAAVVFFSFIFIPDSFNKAVTLVTDAGAKFGITEANSIYAFVGVVLLVITVLAFIWRQLCSKLRINEVKIRNTTITPHNKDNESIFNKNMDEIVYFFEETKYRVVFFEDLDRLDSSKIFVQLRELNTLLNNSDTIKRPIVFVYAVKDDIFTEEDRTKFFEFIIPVIPVINSTNSGEILLDLFRANGDESFKHDITLDYILDISPYISDMRVLQNIHNEFLLYKRTLRTGQRLELSDKMMLSLIIFKNLFPKDFADLEMETGTVKKAFKDKQDYVEAKQKTLQDAIEESVDLIDRVTNDVLKSAKEIKISMLCALAGWRGIVTEVGGSWSTDFTVDQILSDSFDLSKLLSSKDRYIYYRDWKGNKSGTHVQNFADISRPYYERLKHLKTFEEKQLTSIQEEVEKNKLIKSQISGWSLKRLIDEEGYDSIFSDEVKNNKLLVFLLRKGYIDEKYVSYVNYFKGSSITTDDMNYILSVKNHEAKSFDYAISKVSQVVQRLLPHEFEQREILNFAVLEYLLASGDSEEKLLAMIEQLSDGKEHSWKFIDEFVMQTSHSSRFVQLLSQSWDKMWEHIYHDPVLTYNRKVHYLSLLCSYVSVDTLVKLNGKNKLMSKFFEEHDDILQMLSSVETEKMVSIIPSLDISFYELKIEGVESDILACIFENRLYAINSEMIHNVVAYQNISMCERLKTQNYTTIINLGYAPLIEYIHDNLAFYIDNIVLDGMNRDENITQIIALIERSFIDVDRCKRIIQFENFSLSNICQCCSNLYSEHKSELRSIWDILLDCGKIEPLWENVDRYWRYFGLSDILTEYIGVHADVLARKESTCLDDALQEEIIQLDIKPPVFTKLLKHMHLTAFNIPLVNIIQDNVEVMIRQHFFAFSAERYEELSKCYPALCEIFILENKDDFLTLIPTVSLNEEVFGSLVKNMQTDNTFKERIINNYGVLLMSKKTAEQVCALEIPISKEVFDAAWVVLDVNGKKALMIDHLDILQAKDFEICFAEIGKPYQELVDRSKRHKVTIPDSEDHRKLAIRLQEVDYITSYENKSVSEYDDTVMKMVGRPVITCRVKADSNNRVSEKK